MSRIRFRSFRNGGEGGFCCVAQMDWVAIKDLKLSYHYHKRYVVINIVSQFSKQPSGGWPIGDFWACFCWCEGFSVRAI